MKKIFTFDKNIAFVQMNIQKLIDQLNEKNVEQLIDVFSISNVIITIIDIKNLTLNIVKVFFAFDLICDLIFEFFVVSIFVQISNLTFVSIFDSTFDLTFNSTFNSCKNIALLNFEL